MSVIDALITDRTQEDVDELISLLKAGINPPDHKGAYNASDLNRLGVAIEYIKGILPEVGIRPESAESYSKVVYDLPEGVVNFMFSQPGEGEPNPDNARPIYPAFSIDGIGEIYGGYFDSTTNAITITHQNIYFLDGAYWKMSTYEYPYNSFWVHPGIIDDFPAINRSESAVFSHAPNKVVKNHETDTCAYMFSNNHIYARFRNVHSQNDFQNIMASFADVNTPFQVVYEIREPYTVQLSKKQLEQLAKYIGAKRVIADTFDWNWDYPDIPVEWELNKYISELTHLKSKISDYRSSIELPESMRHMDYEGANQLERILAVTDEVIANIKKSFRGYSGRLHAGGDCLP